MKKYLLSIFFLICLSTYSVHGQNDEFRAPLPTLVPQSPNAASLAIYSDYPVSHYTGVPNISLPLYEIQIDDFTLPITLSYHASGIKVNQEASWVGLGWSLSAGGTISRTVKCVDDFSPNSTYIEEGYYYAPEVAGADKSIPLYPGNPSTFYIFTYSGIYLKMDSEPDIFFYSFPGGSGKFILDKSRGAVLFDKKENIKVEVIANTAKTDHHFVLTDMQGRKYIFDREEEITQYSQSGHLNHNYTDFNSKRDTDAIIDNEEKYTSSWNLSKIILPNQREILFRYEFEQLITLAQESCRKYTIPRLNGSIEAECIRYSKSKSRQRNLRLSQIEWDGGKVEFIPLNRQDVNGTTRALNSIRIYDKNNNLLKGFKFEYDYFNNNTTEEKAYVFKRLKLNKVKEVRYVTNTNGTRSFIPLNNGYSFNYFEGSMPAKNSKNTDHWGYHNGSNYGEDYYASIAYYPYVLSGATKTSNLNYLQIGTLKEIVYPTGGKTTYTYEENTYEQSYWSSLPPKDPVRYIAVNNEYTGWNCYEAPLSNSITFKLTSKKGVKFYMSAENCTDLLDRTYSYEDYNNPIGRLTRTDGNSFTRNLLCPVIAPESIGGVGRFYSRETTYYLDPGEYKFEARTPPRDVFVEWTITGAGDLEYSSTQITESKKGGGLRISQIKTEDKIRKFAYTGGKLLIEPKSHFSDVYPSGNGVLGESREANSIVQLSEPKLALSSLANGHSIGYNQVEEFIAEGNEKSRVLYTFYNEPEEEYSDEERPGMPTFLNFYNGLPKSVRYYSNNTLLQQTDYSYESEKSQRIEAFIFDPAYVSARNYHYQIEWIRKKEEITQTAYRQQGEDAYTIRRYSYNPYHRLASEKLFFDQDETEWREKRYFYASDYQDAISQSMTDAHMIGMPIETISLTKEGAVTHGKRTVYKNTLNMLLSDKIQTLKASQPLSITSYRNAYTSEVYFNKYNRKGKPIQMNDNDIYVVYLWSYGNQYPIAEIKNANYQQVIQALGWTDNYLEELAEKLSPSSQDWAKIQSLRTTLPGAAVSTYTYKPLVGVTSITDPAGAVIYYDYDDFGRLKNSYRKENGNKQILQQYHYQFKPN